MLQTAPSYNFHKSHNLIKDQMPKDKKLIWCIQKNLTYNI